MKIAIVDDSKTFLKYIASMLNETGFKQLNTFLDPIDFLESLKKDQVDVVLIDYIMPKMDGIELIKKIKEINQNIIAIMLTSSKDTNLKAQAINAGADDFLNKDISFPELLAKMKMIKRLVNSVKKEKALSKKLQEEIKYKNVQENLAITKHKKIIKNELSMFFEDNNLIETYYKPKDILNGDTVFSIRLCNSHYVMGIIDAMGKGLSASLTSINATSFLEYSIKKAVEYNDFSFERSVRDFVNYTRSILLEKEMLSAILIYIERDKLYYANFGMPPIYTNTEKILSNNIAINSGTKKYNIDQIALPNEFYIISDGLIESPMKDHFYPYYAKFIKQYKESNFVKDIIKDFEEYAIQKDDISLIHFKKDTNYDILFNLEKEIYDQKDIDEILKTIYAQTIPQKNKITYILQELLMNTLEHTLYDMKTKKQHLSIKDVEKVIHSTKVSITIEKDKNYIRLIYSEDSKGFDLNILNELIFSKYHGRGIKIIKHLSDALFFNKRGNQIKIFLKDEK